MTLTNDDLNALWNMSGVADEGGNHQGNIFEYARMIIERCQPAPMPQTEEEITAFVAETLEAFLGEQGKKRWPCFLVRSTIARYCLAANETLIDTCFDDQSVEAFAVAMKAKLTKKREQGYGGWQHATAEHLSRLLFEHLTKGDPVDIANFAMMLHQNSQPIVGLSPVAVEARPWDRQNWCDQYGRCWAWDHVQYCWRFVSKDVIPRMYGATVCLPHWAMPIPDHE